MNIAAIRRLVDSYKISMCDSDKWLVWCLSAGLFGTVCALMSVGLVGPPTTIYYMMLGFAGVMPAIVARPSSLRGGKLVRLVR
ncbi:hypothetical protein ES703_84860 [subsurface metagenome]